MRLLVIIFTYDNWTIHKLERQLDSNIRDPAMIWSKVGMNGSLFVDSEN